MSYNREYEINKEEAADFLKNTVEKIKTEENIEMLADLVSVFKKNVPFTLRKYVTAYLLKEVMKNTRSFNKNNTRGRNSSFKNRNERDFRCSKPEFRTISSSERESVSTSSETVSEERPQRQRVQIDEDKAKSIFISVGKNRRVYPRDLVGILVNVANLDRDRIGDIKIFANFSFIKLYKEDAEIAIEKLNGYAYKGTSLSVSFSRKKGNDEEGDSMVNSVPASENNQNLAAEDAAAYAAAEKAVADKEPFSSGFNS